MNDIDAEYPNCILVMLCIVVLSCPILSSRQCDYPRGLCDYL
jgi:hypothetical protein